MHQITGTLPYQPVLAYDSDETGNRFGRVKTTVEDQNGKYWVVELAGEIAGFAAQNLTKGMTIRAVGEWDINTETLTVKSFDSDAVTNNPYATGAQHTRTDAALNTASLYNNQPEPTTNVLTPQTTEQPFNPDPTPETPSQDPREPETPPQSESSHNNPQPSTNKTKVLAVHRRRVNPQTGAITI